MTHAKSGCRRAISAWTARAITRSMMSDEPGLRPATPDEIATALSFALRYRGRKRVFDADDAMARITANRLVQHREGVRICGDEAAAAWCADDLAHAVIV
jgi:hypothetical protein